MRRHGSGAGCGARGLGKERIPSSRAAPGLRPEALGPPARSWLTVRAPCLPEAWLARCSERGRVQQATGWQESRRKRGPAAVKTPHGAPRGAARRSQDARRASQSAALWAPRGAPSPRFVRGQGKKAGVPRAAKNRGDVVCPGERTRNPDTTSRASGFRVRGLKGRAPE
jgi:hypothetical protein